MVSVETNSGKVAVLSQGQMAFAANVAKQLHDKLRKRGVRDGHGLRKEDATNEMEAGGAQAELAAAFLLGVPWSASESSDPKGPDVGSRTQIRSSNKPRSGHHLIIRTRDIEKYGDVPFVLIIQTGQRFQIKGWVMAYEGLTIGRLWDGGDESRPPAYFVHESKLHPICELTKP